MDNISFPLRFVPFLRPMVWGGRNLANLLHKTLPTAENYGESWEVSDHPLHQSQVASGPLTGVSLRTLMEQQGQKLLGKSSNEPLPWLIKFLDASDWLSVQVHPDDVRVKELWPGEAGKTEAWFILAAQPQSRIYAGLLPGVGPKEFSQAMQQGNVTQLLHSFTPRPGQCVFLPAGTVHALGGGVVLAEIQQTSDATFRLFDWNRVDSQGKSRKLHLQEGLAAIDWSRGPVQPIGVQGFGQPNEEVQEKKLVSCPYFHLSYVYQVQPFTLPGNGFVQALVILEGEGQLGNETFATGQVWLLPASLSAKKVIPQPSIRALVCTLPRG
jgi:mannose-6-phosphate isomerase